MRGEPLAPGSIRPSEHSLDLLEEAVDLLGVESGGPPMSELDGSIDQGGRGPPVPCPGRAPTFAHGDDVDVALAAHIAAERDRADDVRPHEILGEDRAEHGSHRLAEPQ